MTGFSVVAFPSALAVEAILFGALGFWYSVYALYSSLATPENSARPAVVQRIRVLCQLISVLIGVNAAVTLYSLTMMGLSTLPDILLAVALGGTIVAIAVIAGIWSFRSME